jgi:MFS family permease
MWRRKNWHMAITTQREKGNKRAARPTRWQARYAFTILFTINVLNYADRYVLSAVMPKIKQDFGLTDFHGGLLISSFLLVYALATLPLGRWADRGIRKNIVALCVALWSVATLFAGLSRNILQLFSMRSVLGIGEAGYGPATISLLGDYFPKGQRGRVLSYWSVATLVGGALGVAVGGHIADAYGWRWAFFVVGLPGLIAAFLAWRLREPKRGSFEQEEDLDDEGDEHESSENFWRTVHHLLTIPTYWILLGALTFSLFAIGGTSFWLPTYLVREFHFNLSRAGSLSGIVLIVSGLLGTLIGGWLSDHIQRRRPEGRLLTATLGLLIGAPLVLIALLTHNLFVFVTVFVFAGIALNFCTGPLNAVLQDIVRPGMRATAVGLLLLCAHVLGDAAAPTLIGLLSDIYRLNIALLITTPTFIFLGGLVCLLGLRNVARDMRRAQELRVTTGELQ